MPAGFCRGCGARTVSSLSSAPRLFHLATGPSAPRAFSHWLAPSQLGSPLPASSPFGAGTGSEQVPSLPPAATAAAASLLARASAPPPVPNLTMACRGGRRRGGFVGRLLLALLLVQGKGHPGGGERRGKAGEKQGRRRWSVGSGWRPSAPTGLLPRPFPMPRTPGGEPKGGKTLAPSSELPTSLAGGGRGGGNLPAFLSPPLPGHPGGCSPAKGRLPGRTLGERGGRLSCARCLRDPTGEPSGCLSWD